jgi:hypothetical protein
MAVVLLLRGLLQLTVAVVEAVLMQGGLVVLVVLAEAVRARQTDPAVAVVEQLLVKETTAAMLVAVVRMYLLAVAVVEVKVLLETVVAAVLLMEVRAAQVKLG